MWARKQFICVIGMSLTKMAAGKRANGSYLQLQGLEGSDLPSANRLYRYTTVVNSYVRKSRVFLYCLPVVHAHKRVRFPD